MDTSDKKTDITSIPLQYTPKANWYFSGVNTFIIFQFFIMVFFAPAHIQAAYTLHQGSDVEIQGDYAYVAVTGTSNSATDVVWMTPPPPELASGLRVIDISDPDSPKIVGELDYSNSGILCLTVEGDLAYLAYSGSESVKIIDISDPEDPEFIGTIKDVYAIEIVVSHGYAYIADPELGLVIFDVSDPDSPESAAHLNLKGEVEDISVEGDFAYLTFEDDNYIQECGVHICDISAPENPSLAATIVVGTEYDSDVQASGGPMEIWLNGDYAYLAKESTGIIVDVSDPENPSREEIWHLSNLPPYAHVPSIKGLTGSGEYIYLIGSGDEGQEKVFTVDISDPLDPDPDGDVTTFKANGLAVQGDYACIIGWDGFQIIDISDPDDPSVVAEIKSISQSGIGWRTSAPGGFGLPYFPGYGQPGYGYVQGVPAYGYPSSYPGAGFDRPPNFGFNYPTYGVTPGYSLGLPGNTFGRPGYQYEFGQPIYGFGLPEYRAGYHGGNTGPFPQPPPNLGLGQPLLQPYVSRGVPSYSMPGIIGANGMDYTFFYNQLSAINTKPLGWY